VRAQKMTEKIMRYWDWRQNYQILVSIVTAKTVRFERSRIFYYRFLLNFVWNNRFLFQFI